MVNELKQNEHYKFRYECVFVLSSRFLYWRYIVSGLSILSRIEVINLKDADFS